MKSIKIKYVGMIKMGLIALSVPFLFTSCLKDKGPVQDFSQSPALVSFQYSGFSAEPYIASVFGKSTDSTVLEVTLSVASLTLSTPVTATIAADDASLADYNAANGTDYTQLSSSLYSLQNGGTVTINPGEQIVKFSVYFAGDQIDFTQNNALALKITDATGATIATNLNTAILLIKLRNPYEGTYLVTGYFVHPSAPRAENLEKSLVTVTAVTSSADLGDLGGFGFNFDTDPITGDLSNWVPTGTTADYGPDGSGFLYTDNAAGNATYPGPPYVSSTYNNKYDATTHTFWMHYGYNGGGGVYTREIYEKWVLEQ